jgi:hypothetical protein
MASLSKRPPDVGRLAESGAMDAASAVALYLAGLAREGETRARLGLGRGELRTLLEELSLAGCELTPVDVDPTLRVTFLDTRTCTFGDPTFDGAIEAIAAARYPPPGWRIPARVVLEGSIEPDMRAPASIILHVGRCGSTLLCNLLANSGGWTALREPEFLNKLILARTAAMREDEKVRIDALSDRLFACLARGDRRGRRAVKLSSWTAAAAADRLARSGVNRFVGLVRDPSATVASFLEQPPYWTGDRGSAGKEDDVRFFARAWVSAAETMLRLPRAQCLLLRYEEMVENPFGVLRRVRLHFGDTRPLGSEAKIRVALASYSKGRTGERFEPSGQHRRLVLEPLLQRIVAEITTPAWRAVRHRLD